MNKNKNSNKKAVTTKTLIAVAVSTICKFSDCTVAYREDEFQVLVEFIKDALKN